MGNNTLVTLVAVIICIDVFLFLANVSVDKINPEQTEIFTYQESLIHEYDVGGYALNNTISSSALPNNQETVGISGDIFTDTFRVSTNWFTSPIISGGSYLFQFLGGPTHYLIDMNAPSELVYAIGVLWYGTTLIIIVAFILGRL